MSTRVIIIDAYDSFVHIIVGYIKKLGCETRVFRKDDPSLFEALNTDQCDMVVLGPGPGHPAESGYFEVLKHINGSIPVFGICLGHQAIGMYFGATINYVSRLMHGKTSLIHHDNKGCFSSYKKPYFKAMRYHSIIIEKNNLPTDLIITATSDTDNYIMGIRHRHLSIEGVQFHPESIGTESGLIVIKNYIEQYCKTKEYNNAAV